MTSDAVGDDLADDPEAREQAIAVLVHAARDAMPDGDDHGIVARVRDDARGALYEARPSVEGRWAAPQRG